MKKECISEALGNISQKHILEAEGYKASAKVWTRWVAVAACLALVIGIGTLLRPAPTPIPTLDPRADSQIALRYEGQEPQSSGKAQYVYPQTSFEHDPVVLARAVEVLPEIYETMPTSDLGRLCRWRVFRLEIIDPLDTGLTGDLWLGIPEDWYQDLTAWESLLISLNLEGFDYSLRNAESGSPRSFDRFYTDSSPFLGGIIAFTDGVFDESLWRGWVDPPYYPTSAYEELDSGLDLLLVHRGSTLEETLAAIEERRGPDFTFRYPDTLSEAAQAAMDSLDEAYLGTGFAWDSEYQVRYIEYTRYLGGCPTNDTLRIHPETGEVQYLGRQFTAGDRKNLPDLSAYIADMDLDALELPEDEVRGKQLYRAVYGWYEKTADGVRAFVKVTWYHDSTDRKKAYVVFDEICLELTLEGAEIYDQTGPEHLLWKV